MKYHATCQCCGHKVTAYTINLSQPMVEAFKIFMKEYMETGYRGLKKGDIGLTNAQYSNRQNMVHFNIIEMVASKRFPTKLGWNFYDGLAPILTPAGFMGGKTLPDDHEAWITHEPRKWVYIHDLEQKYQDQKDKYQDEATKAKTIY